MKQLKRFRLALGGLLLLHILVLSAGFIAPYDFAEQNRENPFCPPTRLHLMDANGKLHLRPFVYTLRASEAAGYVEDRSYTYPIRLFVRSNKHIGAGLVSRLHLFGTDSPARISLMGTDGYGRDIFSRFLYGGRISLFTGLFATLLSLLFGAILGSIAGFYGGWLDTIITRCSEIFLSLPWVYLLLALRATLPLHITPAQVFLLQTLLIGTIGWVVPSRLVRSQVLTLKERGYVQAARTFGGSNFYLMRQHIVPQTLPVLATQFSVLIPQYVLIEVTLSFVGLGVGEPTPSWGSLLSDLQQYHVMVACWWMFLPGLVLIPLFVSYGFLCSHLQGTV